MRQEHHHHTPEQVRAYLREALAITEELDPPEELRQVTFLKAADWLSAKQIVLEQVQPALLNMAIPKGRPGGG